MFIFVNRRYNKMDKKLKIRIKYPSGIEFEAEGDSELVLKEKIEFEKKLNLISVETQNNSYKKNSYLTQNDNNIWQKIIKFKENNIPYIYPKIENLTINDACLIILSALRYLKDQDNISAIRLSKALKASGFNPKRLDREIAALISEKKISAYGTKRNRTYQINQNAVQDAYIKIKETLNY